MEKRIVAHSNYHNAFASDIKPAIFGRIIVYGEGEFEVFVPGLRAEQAFYSLARARLRKEPTFDPFRLARIFAGRGRREGLPI